MLGKRFHQPWYHIPPDDVDPAIELFQTVIWPLSDYFISLTSPTDDTVRLARSLADETVRALSTGSGVVIERALLDGLVVDHPMTVGRVALTRIGTSEWLPAGAGASIATSARRRAALSRTSAQAGELPPANPTPGPVI
jgi:hypothetical protein